MRWDGAGLLGRVDLISVAAARLDGGDGDGLVEVEGAGELIEEEGGEVIAGDFVSGIAVGWVVEFDFAAGFVVGEDGGADDGVVEVAGGDFCFHVGLVGGAAAEEGGQEQVVVDEGGVGAAIADAEGGDHDEAADAEALHGVDEDASGIGFEAGFFVGGGAADGVDDGVLAGDGAVDDGGVQGVAFDDLDGCGHFHPGVDEGGDVEAAREGLGDDGHAGFAAGAEDEKFHGCLVSEGIGVRLRGV